VADVLGLSLDYFFDRNDEKNVPRDTADEVFIPRRLEGRTMEDPEGGYRTREIQGLIENNKVLSEANKTLNDAHKLVAEAHDRLTRSHERLIGMLEHTLAVNYGKGGAQQPVPEAENVNQGALYDDLTPGKTQTTGKR
jgi:hypothetical protein